MYHFVNGYTAKIAGTEQGVDEPEATFSACFGAAFMVRHPRVYAELLADRIRRHGTRAWLVNTGWSGGPYGVGSRIKLGHTRAMIDAIHSGALDDAEGESDPLFELEMLTSCPNVPQEILIPRNTWSSAAEYDSAAGHLAELFRRNYAAFEED